MAITRTQKGSANAAGSGTTLSVSLTGIASGSLVVCGASFDTTGGTTGGSITDDLSVAAHNDVDFDDSGDGQELQIYSFKNYGGGNRTITLHNSPAQTLRMLGVVETAGADTGTPFVGSSTNTGSGTALTSGNQSPAMTRNGGYAMGVSCVGTSVPATPTAPLTEVGNDSGNGDGTDVSDLLQATAGAINAAWTVSPSATWGAIEAGYQPPSGTTPTPAPGKSVNLARARFKLRSRLAQLREHGRQWFHFFGPAIFPLRNTTLVPSKWLLLSSRIGSTTIQRGTVGTASALVAGRGAGTKKQQRQLLTHGKLNVVFPAIFPARNTTLVPSKWIDITSLIGSGVVQRATTGVISANFNARDDGERNARRRARATGAVVAKTWLPPPPFVPTGRPGKSITLQRVRAEFVHQRRLRPLAVTAQRGLPVITALGWVPKPSYSVTLSRIRENRQRLVKLRPVAVTARTWLPPPPVFVPTPKPALSVSLMQPYASAFHALRRLTEVDYQTGLVVLPGVPGPYLAGRFGVLLNSRVDGARRAHIRHERAHVSTATYTPAPPPPLPVPKPGYFASLARVHSQTRAHRRHESTAVRTWQRPIGPPLAAGGGTLRPHGVVATGRTATQHRQRSHIATTGRVLAQWRAPTPQPVVQLQHGTLWLSRARVAHRARVRHEAARPYQARVRFRLPLQNPLPHLGVQLTARLDGDDKARIRRASARPFSSWRIASAAPIIVFVPTPTSVRFAPSITAVLIADSSTDVVIPPSATRTN